MRLLLNINRREEWQSASTVGVSRARTLPLGNRGTDGQPQQPGFTDTQSILQLHVRMDEKVAGHGVGLAVVSDLVASHQGELKLSRSQWGGAQLDIVLPAA